MCGVHNFSCVCACVCGCVSGNIIGCRTQTRSCSIKELDKAVLSACTVLHLHLIVVQHQTKRPLKERCALRVYMYLCAHANCCWRGRCPTRPEISYAIARNQSKSTEIWLEIRSQGLENPVEIRKSARNPEITRETPLFCLRMSVKISFALDLQDEGEETKSKG